MKLSAYRIFISGTYNDLKSERQAAVDILTSLEYIPVAMPFPAAPGSGIQIKSEESISELEKCDAMILIVGSRYGEPDLPGDPRSITEVEYDWAMQHKTTPCFVFVQDSWASSENDPVVAEQHRRFKAKIDQEKIWASFKNPDDLKSQIQLALHNHPIAELVANVPYHRWDQFFRQQLADDAPPHISLKHPLLCRSSEMRTLTAFLNNQNSKICALVGGQGLGKSRLLLELAQKKSQGSEILFLNDLAFDSRQFDKDALEAIPKMQGTVLVFDDAHDVQGLHAAVRQILTARPLIKIVLAGRPTPEYTDALNSLQDDYKTYQTIQITISILQEGADLETYVNGQFNGTNNSGQLARKLLHSSGGIPWVFHFAVLFLKEKGGTLPPGLISRDASFRNFVIRKILGNRYDTPQSQVLQWLALIAPAARDRKDWGEIFQNLIGTTDEVIKTAIDLWCQERMLRIKGYSLRFTSEIVRDFFVLELAHAPALCDNIFESFRNPLLKNVLKNLAVGAALDQFDDTGQPSRVAPVFEAVWERFRSALYEESPFGQQEILEWLEPVAWYLPAHVRDVLAHIYQNPSTKPNPKEMEIFQPCSQSDVLEKFPSLLEAIAHHRDYFDWACDLLWELAIKDERETNPHPEHSMRVLEKIAGYRPGKPLWLTDRLLDRVAIWIQDSSGKAFRHSPIGTIIGEALSREAEFTRMQGFSFSFGAMPVPPTNLVLNIQNKAIDILFTILCDQGQTFPPRFVIDAIEELIEYSSWPHINTHTRASDADNIEWTKRSLDILDRIKQMVGQITFSPIVRFQLWRRLEWLATHADAAHEQKAIDIRQLLEASQEEVLEFRIYQCSLQEFLEDEDVWTQRRKEVANELLQQYRQSSDLMQFLDTITGNIKRFQLSNLDPHLVLMEAAQANPDTALKLAKKIIQENKEMLLHFLPYLVGPCFLNTNLVNNARSFIREYLFRLPYAVYGAEIYRGFPPKVLTDDDYNILENLVALPAAKDTVQLRFSLLDTFWQAIQKSDNDKTRLKSLLFNVDVNGNERLTNELFMILRDKEIVSLLSDEDKKKATENLRWIKEFNRAYHAEQFLAHIAQGDPWPAIDLFKDRLRLAAEGEIERAFPYTGFDRVYAALQKSKDISQILRAIRDMTLDFAGVQLMEIQRVFSGVAGVFGEQEKIILKEWIDSGDSQKVDLAIDLLREAPNSFVSEHVDFIDSLFRGLIAMPGDQTERRKHLSGTLFNAVIQGVEWRAPGSPSPKYKNLFDKATEIAKNTSGKLCPDTVQFYKSLAMDAAATLADERISDEDVFEE